MTGFEPATTGITIRALPTELHPPLLWVLHYQANLPNGAPDRIRTCDHPLRRRMLYQLSYRRMTDDKNIMRYFRRLIGRSSRIRTYDPWSQTRCTTRLCYAPSSQLLLYRTSCGTVCILGGTLNHVNT